MFQAVIGFFSGLFSVVGKIMDRIHDNAVDAAGQNKVIVKDLKEANDAAKKALEAANNTDADAVDRSLRDGKY